MRLEADRLAIRKVLEVDEGERVVEVREREAELWTGERLGPERAMERFGADADLPLLKIRTAAEWAESDHALRSGSMLPIGAVSSPKASTLVRAVTALSPEASRRMLSRVSKDSSSSTIMTRGESDVERIDPFERAVCMAFGLP